MGTQISKVRYISVNKSNYQSENARLMKQISIINNINGAVDIQWGKAYSLASLKRKKLLSTTPLKLALNSFIFALKDSAAAFVDLLI